MKTILRLRPYFRSQWKTIGFGLGFMALYALLSGFSIILVLPILREVFMQGDRSQPVIHVADGLRSAWAATSEAWNLGGGLTHRFDAARDAMASGLTMIQDHAPRLELLTWLCVITLVAIFFKNVSEVGRRIAFIRVEQATTEALRRDLFRRVVHLPFRSFHRIPTGQFLGRMVTDVELIKQLTINTAASFIHNFFQVLVFLGISIWASYQLALGSLLIVPPIAILTGKLAHKLNKQSGRAQNRIADLTGSLNETLGGIRIVKAFGTEPEEENRFGRATHRYRRAVVKLLSLDSIAAPLSEFWGVAMGVAVLFFGGQLMLKPDSDMDPGRFFLFFFALVSMIHPLKQLANVVTRFQRGAAAATRVFEILDMPVETEDPQAQPIAGFERDIVFDKVSFLYEPERPVLKDISFRAPAGTTTALVGPSGAGKSTLADLIPRFYDPDSGSILIDGVDLRRVRRRDLRALIGIVSQEPILFDDTVAKNIAYGTPGADRRGIEEAARAANADEFIEEMVKGYETRIGERGARLSGGQRQRLAIARAVLRNPPLLILDEATSSLDTESEALVQEALERLLEGRTTFIIAHRLSTVMRANQILVLDHGRLVERGTHPELLARGGLYHRLYTLQFRTEETPSLDAVES